MKMLITGASGFLGNKIKDILKNKYDIIGTYHSNPKNNLHKLDITNKNEVNQFIKEQNPDAIIHSAAMPDPDDCENNKELAEKINHQGTRNIVNPCKKIGAKLIHISTIYVFDGEEKNYNENHKPNPVNFYGKTKLKAEKEVISALNDYVVLRFDVIYGFNGKNKSNGYFSKILKNKELYVDDKKKRQPLFVDDVAYAIPKLINEKGVYHLAGPDVVTKYELSLPLEKIIRNENKLIPVKNNPDQIAKRPSNITINTEKAESLGIKLHSIQEAVDRMKEQYDHF